ncbi:MAG: radical SAM protein [Gammaproteobacteria bacterium]|nr:radical SAM protein [Gammaproteobacteria bacterium]
MEIFSDRVLEEVNTFFDKATPINPQQIDFKNPYFTQPKHAVKEQLSDPKSLLAGLSADHLYVHVPFCATHCLYCHYPTLTNAHSPENQLTFLENIEKEWNEYQEIGVDFSKVKTVHIGGGTPNCLDPDNLERLTKNLSEIFKPSIEYAAELYPSPYDLTEEKFQILANNGVDRVSIGIQTFNYAINERNRRINQKPEDLFRILKLAKQYFNNVSIDLLYGQKEQTLDDLSKDFEITRELEINSVYLYQTRELIGKRLIELQKALNMFLKYFSSHGYEIVSFDQVIKKRNNDGFCAHRSGRSLSENLLGIGPGSVSEMGEYIFKTVSPEVYANQPGIDLDSVVKRSERTQKLEYLNRAFRHFNTPGINGMLFEDYRKRFGIDSPVDDFPEEIEFLKNNKLIAIDNSQIEITNLGMLFTQPINNYLLGHYK